ncbi:integrase [Escherichia coli]|uniref:Integrase n=2 Tax=Escherichia coli TaxID=562 RepID=A0A4V5J389_ECOLX|nr:tyrosine-type recombinase/integrase [Escherichia coli]EEV8183168.1 tyrosine-type recombinase/integrase [Escherichia coli]EEY0694962.1 tyrosine-type recombinase/integrase [Escherichia coli]EEY0696026.1 tyrosine-type recombinase/integrase [Escherichia coli]EGJ7477578.1 tyrosine-type recombinase/integrase [Escherichia coli]
MRYNQFSHYKRSDTLAGEFMRYKPNQYIICDSYGNYYLRITLPVYMQPFFEGKRTFVRSLHTSNLRVARRKRDQIADEYHCLRESVAPVNSTIENTLELLRSKAKYAKTATRVQDTASSCPSLLKILEIYLTINSTKKKPATLAKARKAVEMFLSYRKKPDIALQDVSRTTVTGWIEHMQKTLSQQSIANYISPMAQLWELASSRYHDAPERALSPWRGHRLDVAQSRESYEAFSNKELLQVLQVFSGDSAENKEMMALCLIGLYTGMRINEIASLTIDDVKEIEGVLCFEITQGKTKAAARVVPVHSLITPLVLSLREKPHNGFLFYHASITERADGKRSTWHTQRFTRAKRKALGEKGTERKVFHSLRHGVAQLLDRNQIPEDRIALLLGHTRGNTETFRTYSKNAASPVELKKYIELLRYPEIEKGLSINKKSNLRRKTTP